MCLAGRPTSQCRVQAAGTSGASPASATVTLSLFPAVALATTGQLGISALGQRPRGWLVRATAPLLPSPLRACRRVAGRLDPDIFGNAGDLRVRGGVHHCPDRRDVDDYVRHSEGARRRARSAGWGGLGPTSSGPPLSPQAYFIAVNFNVATAVLYPTGSAVPYRECSARCCRPLRFLIPRPRPSSRHMGAFVCRCVRRRHVGCRLDVGSDDVAHERPLHVYGQVHGRHHGRGVYRCRHDKHADTVDDAVYNAVDNAINNAIDNAINNADTDVLSHAIRVAHSLADVHCIARTHALGFSSADGVFHEHPISLEHRLSARH